MPKYTVKQGDCIVSLSARTGVAAKKIWQESANASLAKKRPSPCVLLPGDSLELPEITEKKVSVADKIRHKFRVKRGKATLRLKLTANGNALAGEPVSVTVGNRTTETKVGGDGSVEVPIDPQATSGQLLIKGRIIPFSLGSLDPVSSVTGQQARMTQMGIFCGPIDGICGPLTRAGIKAFQRSEGIAVDGIAGPVTQSHLEAKYGC